MAVPAFGVELDPPGTRPLRVAFLVLWLTDLVLTSLFFRLHYARELNPITVRAYEVLGLSGVTLAAAGYASVVVAVGQVLPDPWDVRFLGGVSVLYAIFAINNVPLVLFGEPVVFGSL